MTGPRKELRKSFAIRETRFVKLLLGTWRRGIRELMLLSTSLVPLDVVN